MQDSNYYEQRYVVQNLNEFNFWFGDTIKQTLSELVFKNDKIVLLGNPGLGKTKELDVLFETLWDAQEVNGLIPFLINLKNFRTTNKFEDLIPYKEWEELEQIIFILDGLDEVAVIQDFLSAFELFISQNKQRNIKYVISCRTNIFDKYLVNISDFNAYYLENLNIEQSKSILVKKYNIDLTQFNFDEKHTEYLKTPFFLDLFAKYIEEKGTLPKSDSEMWSLYIDTSLNNQTLKQSKKGPLNKVQLDKNLKKVAFVNELMQQNYSSTEQLDIITGNYLDFVENPFFNELEGSPELWSFNHRQIQEYLVAKVLSHKSFEEIINIIAIPGIDVNKVPPSLFNTITFLINLLDKESELYSQLVNWLIDNQIELLIKADSDRTATFQVHVFQSYFQSQCIDKGYWLTTHSPFTIKELAGFGDCDDNFEYLINYLDTSKYHFRVVISAIQLVSLFNPNPARIAKLKPNFLELLAAVKIDDGIKSETIRSISRTSTLILDKSYVDEVFNLLKDESSKEINSSLLYLLTVLDNVDPYFDYIKMEFLREKGFEKREVEDEVLRGNEWKLDELLLKFEDYDNFIEIVAYYFQDEHYLNIDSHFVEGFLNRFDYFMNKESEFISKFVESIKSNKFFYNNQDVIIKIITNSKQQVLFANALIENCDFIEVRYFISTFASTEILELILDLYKKGKIDAEQIKIFRINLWNSKRDLSFEFEKLMIANGFEFDEPLWNDSQIDERKAKVKAEVQANFDLLFDCEKLLKEVEAVFGTFQVEEIDEEKYFEIRRAWIEQNDYPAYSSNVLHCIKELVDENHTLKIKEVADLIKDDHLIYQIALSNIKGNNRDNLKFEVSAVQNQTLVKWCQTTAELIDFDNIIGVRNSTSYYKKRDFDKFCSIVEFQNYIAFDLSVEFYLNSLPFYDILKLSQNEDEFKFLIDKINDKPRVTQRIIDNIKSGQLLDFVYEKHLSYAIKNELSPVLQEIKTYFLNNINRYGFEDKLKLYYNWTQDSDLLKQCCEDINQPMCWSAIELLTNLNEISFCIEVAKRYVEQSQEGDNTKFISEAMIVLFHFNTVDAIDAYLNLPEFDFHAVNFSVYDAIENYSVIKTIFFMVYKEKYNKSDFRYSSQFLEAYINNLSRKSNESFGEVQRVLNEIKNELEVNFSREEADGRLFSVNLLLDNATNAYINKNSVPLTFEQALVKVNNIIK